MEAGGAGGDKRARDITPRARWGNIARDTIPHFRRQLRNIFYRLCRSSDHGSTGQDLELPKRDRKLTTTPSNVLQDGSEMAKRRPHYARIGHLPYLALNQIVL